MRPGCDSDGGQQAGADLNDAGWRAGEKLRSASADDLPQNLRLVGAHDLRSTSSASGTLAGTVGSAGDGGKIGGVNTIKRMVWGSQHIAAEVLILGDLGKLLRDVGRVYLDVFLFQLGSLERNFIEDALEDGV